MSRPWKGALAVLTMLVAACGGAANPGTSKTTAVEAAAAPTTTTTPKPGNTDTTLATVPTTIAEESATGVIPAGCAEGFAEYLVEIEPMVADFDPTTALIDDYYRYEDAVIQKSRELLDANDSRAPYSCSEVGLEWAYFDTDTPWEAVLEIARTQAPGTVAYLEATRDLAAAEEVSVVTDYGVTTCEEAVAGIKQSVADQIAAGNDTVAYMSFPEGLALLGLIDAYYREVREERCPRDQLGNEQIMFISFSRIPG